MSATQVKNDISNYTPAEILAISFEVFDAQGFVKSGYGYKEPTNTVDEDGNQIYTDIKDNKTVIIQTVKNFKGKYIPNQKYVDQATAEIERINGKLMMKKLGGGLTNFESGLVRATSDDVNNFHVSILASVPNSLKIDQKREALNDTMSQLKHISQYVGKKGARYDIEVDVIDVKFIQSSDVYMITCVSDNRDIVKFWWREQPDLTDIIEGKTITIRGTVNKQELSKYSNAKETLFNRVKLTLVK
jgi:hypothetical protein